MGSRPRSPHAGCHPASPLPRGRFPPRAGVGLGAPSAAGRRTADGLKIGVPPCGQARSRPASCPAFPWARVAPRAGSSGVMAPCWLESPRRQTAHFAGRARGRRHDRQPPSLDRERDGYRPSPSHEGYAMSMRPSPASATNRETFCDFGSPQGVSRTLGRDR